jgi:hypothetical protein
VNGTFAAESDLAKPKGDVPRDVELGGPRVAG